jgi:hypothetical protein
MMHSPRYILSSGWYMRMTIEKPSSEAGSQSIRRFFIGTEILRRIID